LTTIPLLEMDDIAAGAGVHPGQVGRHGVNSAGIALNANGLDGAFGAPAHHE